ncbi:MAG TPA: glucose-6-phosphate dehydrogenase [Actinomycetota bacterium]|nr:glucose-6-phosphate dehydrogenase [Actinomycetota bacterium]
MTLKTPPNQAIVIFGATGDLTGRKLMPALYNLFIEGLLPDRFAVIGYARSRYSDDEFRDLCAAEIQKYSRTPFDPTAWDRFGPNLRYVSGNLVTPGDLHDLVAVLDEVDRAIDGNGRRTFYAATQPSLFTAIAARLKEEGLNQCGNIVMEKPFGKDVASARELNKTLHDVFDEDQIYRIDHYLGKETVQNILVLRFANGMFEPLWNRRYVRQVQIDVAEDIGIEGRGRFYEEAGALRDIVQNHVMQLLAFISMEPPVSFDAQSIRDEKMKLLRSVPPVRRRERDVVRGQYVAGVSRGILVPGYREEEDVAPDSLTETYIAMRLRIENWRWAGVPFIVRTGKRLPRRATQVTISFASAPHMMFEESGLDRPGPNNLCLRIQPNEGISLTFDAKVPGPEMEVGVVEMDFDYEHSFMTKPSEAYERLLHDVMMEDHTLFMRADEIERAWEIVDPVLERLPPEPYFAGSWGPERAKELVAPHGWHLK